MILVMLQLDPSQGQLATGVFPHALPCEPVFLLLAYGLDLSGAQGISPILRNTLSACHWKWRRRGGGEEIVVQDRHDQGYVLDY
jgi:hypothetical protein